MSKGYRYLIINNFGEDYVEELSTHDLRYECPKCKELGKRVDDKKLYVSYDTLIFHCFRCGWKGKLSSENVLDEGSSNKLIRTLSKYKPQVVEVDETDDILYKLPSVVPSRSDPAVVYLEQRGVSYEDILKFNMRVPSIEDQSRFFGRIVIPNKLILNKWTDMYSARAYIDLTPKYLNPKNSPKNRTVFNLHNISDYCDQIIINEGVLTSIVAGYDSVATYGKAVSDQQIDMILAKHPKRIYISLDNDANPGEGLRRDPTQYKVDELIIKLLKRSNSELYLVKMPPGKDAVDLGREYYRTVLLPNSVRIRDIREFKLYTLKL
jgi:hypothetical protein